MAHTLRLQTHTICNTYCFSTATTVTRTLFNVTLYVHCLSCSTFRRDQNAVVTTSCQHSSTQILEPIIFNIVVSYDCWRQLRTVHGMRCKLICQRIFRTVGDRQEGRDLNEKTLAGDNGRQRSSANSVAYECGLSGSTKK